MTNGTTAGGWLTTKKRGKDEDAIAKDRKKAALALKKKRSKPRKPVVDDESSSSNSSYTAAASQSSSGEEEEGEEEELLVPNKKETTAKVVESDSSEEEEESFFTNRKTTQAIQQRQFKVKPLLQARLSFSKTNADKAITTTKTKTKTTTKRPQQQSKPRRVQKTTKNSQDNHKKSAVVVSKKKQVSKYFVAKSNSQDLMDTPPPSSSSSAKNPFKSSSLENIPPPQSSSSSQRKDGMRRMKKDVHILQSSDDDVSIPTNDKNIQAKPSQKKRIHDDDNDDEHNDTKKRIALSSDSSFDNNNNNHNDDNHQEEDDPDEQEQMEWALRESQKQKQQPETTTSSKKNQFQRYSRKAILSDEESEDDADKIKKKILSTTEYISDPDEQAALEYALQQSRKEQQQKQRIMMEEDEEDDLGLDDLQDSEEDDNHTDDEFMDPQAKEASSVLATANELSARVLTSMKAWSSSDDDGATAVQGMIVDGAIAIDNAAAANASNSSPNQQWIAKSTMERICPQVKLANYQLIGVNWLALLDSMTCDIHANNDNHHHHKNNNINNNHTMKPQGQRTNVNGILADEMGLGKTVQTIAFLAWLKDCRSQEDPSIRRPYQGPHLIVVPASVLSNWERELTNFAPHLNLIKYCGNMEERRQIQSLLQPLCLGKKKYMDRKVTTTTTTQPEILLVPISYFQREKSEDASFLRKISFDYLVVDEAHHLKNARGHRYRHLNRFTTQHRLLLTGTPVQNAPQELMSLLCFLMPLFSRKTAEYDEESNAGGETMLQHFVNLQDKGGSGSNSTTSNDAAYKKLKQLFAPFVLRRKKVDVLQQLLPPKTRKVEMVTLNETSRNLYNSIISKHIEAKKNAKNGKLQDHLFTSLRKAANHPLLLRSRYTSPEEVEDLVDVFFTLGAFRGQGSTKTRVAKELEAFSDFEIHLTALDLIQEYPEQVERLSRYRLFSNDLFASAKFERLRTLLPQLIVDGHRILIFSVWTTLLDLLSCLLEHLEIDYLRMDGTTPVSERQSLMDRFQQESDISVFLLSTKACGMGINLTAADTCIMHDLDFNPFNDLQAEDRCHRIGQKKNVTIIKMVAEDTVDSDIYFMQQKKAKMNAAIMDGPKAKEQEKEEKEMIMKNAMDRFLKSPEGQQTKNL